MFISPSNNKFSAWKKKMNKMNTNDSRFNT
jgi:hypothetical protein